MYKLYSYRSTNLFVTFILQIIFIYRNVKDVMLSFYYHNVYSPSKLHDNLGCFEDFVKDMMEDRVAQCPYFAHLHGYWIHRTDSNVLFLSYEQMLKVTHFRISEPYMAPLSTSVLNVA